MTATSHRTGQNIDRRTFVRRAGASGLLAVPGLSTLLTACGGEEPGAGGRVAYQLAWLKNMQFAGQFRALKEGVYKKNGLEISLMAGGPSVNVATVVSSNNALVGLGASNEIVVARGTGTPVRAIAAAFQKSPFGLISLAESSITTLEGQYGKTVAVSDESRPILESLMEGQGLDPGRVKFVPKSPDPSVLPDGQVQGYWGFVSTEAAVLQSRGVEIETVLLSDLGAPTQENVLFATDETIESQRELLVSLLKADIAGHKAYLDDVPGTAKLVLDGFDEQGGDVGLLTKQGEAQAKLINTGDAVDKGLLWVSPGIFEQNIRSAVDSKLIDKAFPAEDAVTTEIIAEAHA